MAILRQYPSLNGMNLPIYVWTNPAWGVRCRDGYQTFLKLLGDEHPRIVYPASRSTQNITYQTWDIKQGKDMSASSPWIARKDWLENMGSSVGLFQTIGLPKKGKYLGCRHSHDVPWRIIMASER